MASKYSRLLQRPVQFRGLKFRPLGSRAGVTLVELLIVITVVGILAVALGFSYQGWLGGYKAEKQIKELYSDLMAARSIAMTKDREYFVDFPDATSYRIIGDTPVLNNWIADGDGEWDNDGNGVLDPWHTVLPGYPRTLENELRSSIGAKTIMEIGTVVFDKKGLIRPSASQLGATICLVTEAEPDYDCIKISQTRINMGKQTTQFSRGGNCDSTNCVAK